MMRYGLIIQLVQSATKWKANEVLTSKLRWFKIRFSSKESLTIRCFVRVVVSLFLTVRSYDTVSCKFNPYTALSQLASMPHGDMVQCAGVVKECIVGSVIRSAHDQQSGSRYLTRH